MYLVNKYLNIWGFGFCFYGVDIGYYLYVSFVFGYVVLRGV